MQWLARITALTALYPWLCALGIYLTWGMAWLTLGKPPRPALDDPKTITFIAFPYSVVDFMLSMLPIALMVLLLALLAQGILKGRKQPRRYGRIWGMAILLWGTALALLFWDPLGAFNWFLD